MVNSREYIEKKSGYIEYSLFSTLKKYFREKDLGVVKPVKKKWKDISSRKDSLEKSFDELYFSLINTNTKEKLNGLDNFIVKRVYLVVTLGFLLAVINKSRKETFRELAISGTFYLFLQDFTSPIFDEFLQETVYPSFDDKAKIGLHKIFLLFIDELMTQGWFETLENAYSSFNIHEKKDHLSEELIRYYHIKKEALFVESEKYIQKLYK